MRILGLVAKTHDSGLALLSDGRLEAVLEEERLDRRKKSQKFPRHSLAALCEDLNLKLADIDVVTTPWNVGELRRQAARLILRRFPLSLGLVLPGAHRAQQNQIMLLNQYLRRGLRAHFGQDARLPEIVNVGHHDAHAASFFVSPMEEALVLVMDGYGDDASTSAYVGRGNRVERLWHTSQMNSLGLVYTFVTEYLGFAGFGDEGKVMALAAFGDDTYVARFRDVVRPAAEGRYRVNMEYFSYETFGELRPFKPKFIETFGPARVPGAPLEDRHRDIAFALQAVTEEIVLHVVRDLVARTGLTQMCLTGGVALNCVANAKVLEETPVKRLWVPPCASDTGAPLGSALWHHHQTLGRPRTFELTHPFYGREYGPAEIEAALKAAGLRYETHPEAMLIDRVAKDLAAGKVVGWYQGRFEMGPRALGNRSILADPRRAEMREILNDKIKARESFRPFAPAVLLERAAEFFEITQPDPFMTLAPRVRPEKRSAIAAAVHIDGTGRIQTVEREANPRYWGLINAFGKLTGVPVLLNTSFNRKEPIVARPEEAIACFLESGMDVLVMGDFYTTDRRRQDPGKRASRGQPVAAI
ncbi:MAG: carbamoyltransferase C-terminal domain-containing protein [Hyphomicrobiaceae bacterium]|nr:carbamoyltransferase C-terminal domain-containing protein [Hyphomicrobiaceae bacterium]